MDKLQELKDAFIAEWGSLGPAWGMTRAVARTHALLMISDDPMTTDEIMDELSISRGSAHGALKDLTALGIAKRAVPKGQRRETFVAEKDPWRVFCAVMRERKKREVEPVLAILDRCLDPSNKLGESESRSFVDQLERLREFVSIGDRVMETIGKSERSVVLKWMMGLVKAKR